MSIVNKKDIGLSVNIKIIGETIIARLRIGNNCQDSKIIFFPTKSYLRIIFPFFKSIIQLSIF